MTQSQALLCALTAFFGWTAVDVFMKLTGQAGLSPAVVVSVIGATGAGCLFLAALLRGRVARLVPSSWKKQALLALCASSSTFLCAVALRHMTLALFYIMVFTAPLFVAGLSVLLRQEALSQRKIICVVMGFLGVVVSVDPSGSSGDVWGYLAATGAALTFACYTVILRNLSVTDSVSSMQFTSAVANFLTGLIIAVMMADALPDAHGGVMLILAGVANIASGIFYNLALRSTTSTNVVQLHYSQIVFGCLFGFLIWYEVPTWNLWLGAAIIIASGMAVAAEAHRQDKAVA